MKDTKDMRDTKDRKPRRIDLHTHSTASDGLLAPAALVRLAREQGLDLIALTDHDNVGGVAEAQAEGQRVGLTVIPGVEINTDLPEGGGEAHVLGYFVERDQPAFLATLATLRDAREQRGERMVEKLRAQGLDISWERVRELAQGSVGRPHVAEALIERGYARDVSDAFDRWLSRGRPGYVLRLKLSPEDAVRFIRSAYGVPTLAHPADIPHLEDTLLPSLVSVGLLGLECYYGEYDAAIVRRLTDLAAAHSLIATGGSDYHGPGMHPTPLGGRYVPPEAAERLRTASAVLRQRPARAFHLAQPPA
jgi:predicted metal-dependent phosphoesterase TrpH